MDTTQTISTGATTPESEGLTWGSEFTGSGWTVATYRLTAPDSAGITIDGTPESLTATEARELAAGLVAAADSLDCG